jgi:hypothetical protein
VQIALEADAPLNPQTTTTDMTSLMLRGFVNKVGIRNDNVEFSERKRNKYCTAPSHIFKMHFNTILPSIFFPLGFQTKIENCGRKERIDACLFSVGAWGGGGAGVRFCACAVDILLK